MTRSTTTTVQPWLPTRATTLPAAEAVVAAVTAAPQSAINTALRRATMVARVMACVRGWVVMQSSFRVVGDLGAIDVPLGHGCRRVLERSACRWTNLQVR